jgi:hypothetical protein
MVRWATITLAFTLLAVAPVAAGEKAAKKPVGTWTKKAGEATVTFAIKADTMNIDLKLGEAKIEVEADYAVTKDGVLFARIRKITKTGTEGGPGEGDLFSFRYKLAKDKMTLSELKAPETNDQAKELVEGDYEKGK